MAAPTTDNWLGNGDGKPDLVLKSSSAFGATEVQLLNGLTAAGGGLITLNLG